MTGGKVETGRYRQWTRFLHQHVAVNMIMILGYGAFRNFVRSPRLMTRETWTGLTQETEIIGLAIISLVSKYRKIATFDELLERFFFMGKSAVTVLAFFGGVRYAAIYLAIWAATALVVQRPRYVWPAEVEVLTAGEFQSRVRSPTAQTAGKHTAFLVMFHAEWCSTSINLQPMFGHLAQRFAAKDRSYCVVDLVAHEEIGEDLNIKTSSSSKQLPTIALYTNGREVCRLPTFASDGSVVRARMDEHGVTKYFELDKDVKDTSYARNLKTRSRR